MLDGRNRPLIAPNAFDINTSLQRCLVKAIALHGLGLYVYASEDLPQPAIEAANDLRTVPEPMERETRANVRAPGKTISGLQQAQVHQLIIQTETESNRLLVHFGIAQLQDLPVDVFTRVDR